MNTTSLEIIKSLGLFVSRAYLNSVRMLNARHYYIISPPSHRCMFLPKITVLRDSALTTKRADESRNDNLFFRIRIAVTRRGKKTKTNLEFNR